MRCCRTPYRSSRSSRPPLAAGGSGEAAPTAVRAVPLRLTVHSIDGYGAAPAPVLDGPVEELGAMCDDWEITHERQDLPRAPRERWADPLWRRR